MRLTLRARMHCQIKRSYVFYIRKKVGIHRMRYLTDETTLDNYMRFCNIKLPNVLSQRFMLFSIIYVEYAI